MSSSVGKLLPVVCVALLGVPVWAAPSVAEVAPVAELAPVEVAPVEVAPVEVAPVEVAPVEVAPVAADVPPVAAPAVAARAAAAAAPAPATTDHVGIDPSPVEPVPDEVDRPDLTVVVAGPDRGWAGGEGAYTMTVRNAPAATAAASRFTVSYVPSAGQTVQSVRSPVDSPWACALSVEVSCTWSADLEPGAETAPVTVVVGHGRRASGTLTATARVSAADDEVHLADNSRTVSTTMDQPELAVAVDAPESVTPGAPVRLVLAVTNTGPGWASDFSIVGALPDAIAVASVGGTGFDCDVAAGSCAYTDVLGPGLSASVAVDGVLAPSYTGGPLTTTARLGHGGAVASAVTAVAALPPATPVLTTPVTTPVAVPAKGPLAAPVTRSSRAVAPAAQRPAAGPAAPRRTAASTSTRGTAPAADTTAATGVPETLPFTGSRGDQGLAAGVWLLLSGLVVTLAGRRRRTG